MQGETLAPVRSLVEDAVWDIIEEVEMEETIDSMLRGPVWDTTHHLHGRDVQGGREVTFTRGAALEDPAGLFDSSLEGNTRRAINMHQGDKIYDRGVESAHRARSP